MTDIKLLPEVSALTRDELKALALKHAERIASLTPGEPEDAAWCDSEEWMSEAVRLAHAPAGVAARLHHDCSVACERIAARADRISAEMEEGA